MKLRLLLGVLTFVAALLIAGRAASNAAAAQEPKKGETAEEQSQPPMDPEMKAAWDKAATTGEYHRHLDAMVGNWTYTNKMRMGPEQPFMESPGTAKFEWVLDGKFLMAKIDGEMEPGQPFNGVAYMGYDSIKKKYNSFWVCNGSTAMTVGEGTCDDSGKVFTYHHTGTDPMTGKTMKARSVTTVIGPDKIKDEFYHPDKDGKEFLSMEIIYTRVR